MALRRDAEPQHSAYQIWHNYRPLTEQEEDVTGDLPAPATQSSCTSRAHGPRTATVLWSHRVGCGLLVAVALTCLFASASKVVAHARAQAAGREYMAKDALPARQGAGNTFEFKPTKAVRGKWWDVSDEGLVEGETDSVGPVGEPDRPDGGAAAPASSGTAGGQETTLQGGTRQGPGLPPPGQRGPAASQPSLAPAAQGQPVAPQPSAAPAAQDPRPEAEGGTTQGPGLPLQAQDQPVASQPSPAPATQGPWPEPQAPDGTEGGARQGRGLPLQAQDQPVVSQPWSAPAEQPPGQVAEAPDGTEGGTRQGPGLPLQAQGQPVVSQPPLAPAAQDSGLEAQALDGTEATLQGGTRQGAGLPPQGQEQSVASQLSLAAAAQDPRLEAEAPAVTETATPQPAECGMMDVDTDYPGNDLGPAVSSPDPEDCCQRCAGREDCFAWTWVTDIKMCFLKGNHPRGELAQIWNSNAISGKPLQVNRTIRTITREAGQSLFCWSLMLPWSYERGMLAMQYRKGISIFACDEYSVYSNQSLTVAAGLYTQIVPIDLHCKKGGEFGTALNTPIFLAVWTKIFQDDRTRFHDWTVKADADAVFFPDRLRLVVTNHAEEARGVYLNNCKMGMHGPIEVFSRNAAAAWMRGKDQCVVHFSQLCSGPCKWGEDMFIDQCLERVLDVRRDFEPQLLWEDHCAPPPLWWQCRSATVVAFHPFKQEAGYTSCLMDAVEAIFS